jgi:putative acetyltransferase
MAFPSRSDIAIRPEAPGDERAIFAVNTRAFPQPAEAQLVDALRAANAVTFALVAERDGRVVGHILFSPVRVEGEGSSFVAQGLGPVAVDPDCQRDGHAIVFVLGHAAYYPRFGFEPAAPRRLFYSDRSRDYSPVFFVAELEAGALADRSGVVHYRPEFSGT